MDEMMNYIFKTISDSDRAFKAVNKTLRHHRNIDKSLFVGVCICSLFIGYMRADINEQDKKIKELQSTVKAFRLERVMKEE